MSAEHVQRVLDLGERADLTPAARLLLLAYAHHVGPDGTCSKSFRQLGKMCGLDDRTTYRCRRAVEALGLFVLWGKMSYKAKSPIGQKVLTHKTKSPNNATTLARDIINNQEINNTRSNAGARACETSKLAALCRAYPKRTFPNATIKAAWNDCLAEGITPEELIACFGRAKLSKAWEEEGGRYIPKLVVWLNERRFSADLVVVRAERKQQKALKQAQQQELQMAQWAMEDEDEPIEFA